MAKQDLGKIISEITSATASVDNKVGVPSVEVTLGGTQTDKEINFDFKNIKGEKGDKPVKGTDYFTEEEKQQFTTETVGLVTAEGEKQITAIGEKGTTETQKVTAEGTKQVTAVRNQGNTSLQAVNKVQGDIEALLRDQTVEGNALSLNGKTGVQYDKEIQGVAGRHDGTFPLTSAVKDGVYLVPSTGKLYVCITAYNDGQISAPNSNFEEFSVYKNRDRLDNLSKPNYIDIDWNLTNVTAEQVVEIINKNLEIYDYIYFFIRESGYFKLDFSLITKKDNSEITFYFKNGGHDITFTNVHPQNIKFATSGWGNYATFRYSKNASMWYLKSDKGTTKV